MPSTFWGLYISGSGLRAANANLNTTANNVSNADTEGYSRQKVKQEASDALRVFANYGCAGAGVDTLSIDRIRDDFYDVKYRDNATRWGEFDVKSSYMETIESLFTDDGITGFTSIFAKYMTKLQEVMKNPGDASTKADMISQLSSMAEYFNNMNGNLIIQQQALNTEVKVNVDKINSLASEIANLNKQINVIELTGTKANSLRDKRDSLVDELSQIVSVETQEIKVLDAGQKDRDSNVTRYIVKIAGGLNLVDGTDYEEMICKPRDEFQKVNQSDADGLYDIYWKNGDQFAISNSSMGGVLSGLLQLRDGNNAEYFNGKFSASAEKVYGISSVKTGDDISGLTLYEKKPDGGYKLSVDTVAAEGKTYYYEDTDRKAVSVAVTADYLQDLNKSTLPYKGTLRLDGKNYTYDGWDFVKKVEADGYSYSYTFFLTEEATEEYSTANFRTDNASIGSKINYQGIPYYMEQMNEWIRNFSEAFNKIMLEGVTDDGLQGQVVLTGDLETGEATAENGNLVGAQVGTSSATMATFLATSKVFYGTALTSDAKVNCYDDSYYRLTAANFNVAINLRKNSELLATKTGASLTEGESQYDNLSLLVQMNKDKKMMSFRGATAGDFLTSLLGDITLNANNADTFAQNFTTLKNVLQNQRLSISGVDKDEEAENLVNFQNSYVLCSKVISTFTEIYDQLILNTGN